MQHKLQWFFLTVFICSVGSTGNLQAETQGQSSDSHRLTVASKKFLEHAHDFRVFMESTMDNQLEFDTSDQFRVAASDAVGALGRSSDVLFLYGYIPDPPTHVTEFVTENLELNVAEIQNAVVSVNSMLPFTDLPGISQSAITLRDDLRDAAKLLKSIKVE